LARADGAGNTREMVMALVDATQAAGTVQQTKRAFFSPTFDFLCLGGGSLLLLPILVWVIPDNANGSAVYVAALLSQIINHPHFIHSYQIFYRTFGAITADPNSNQALRARYLWAGIGAPVLIALLFAAALSLGDAQTLAYAGNVMMFFVGWHYVKQGYGMLMVDAARRRSYFGNGDKKILLVNSYVCWIVAWIAGNRAVAERDFWGLAYGTFDIPVAVLWVGAAILAITTALSMLVLFRHARAHRGSVPVNGIAAYVAALYPWLLMIREPVLGALIPAMHSLQYLLIVWRYQLNLEQARPDASDRPQLLRAFSLAPTKGVLRFTGFVLCGTILGVLSFMVVPHLLGKHVPYDHAQYGDYLFFFVIVIFINIHHYFIDNVMWRKENPYTLPHLFPRR
jgi:hypothetical protein